jgi:hypothetical protein
MQGLYPRPFHAFRSALRPRVNLGFRVLKEPMLPEFCLGFAFRFAGIGPGVAVSTHDMVEWSLGSGVAGAVGAVPREAVRSHGVRPQRPEPALGLLRSLGLP